jgi:hypothetical protein
LLQCRWTLLEELADGHIAARAAVREVSAVLDIASRLGEKDGEQNRHRTSYQQILMTRFFCQSSEGLDASLVSTYHQARLQDLGALVRLIKWGLNFCSNSILVKQNLMFTLLCNFRMCCSIQCSKNIKYSFENS